MQKKKSNNAKIEYWEIIEKNALLHESFKKMTKTIDNKTIIINARGIKYEILLHSLDKYPNTRLGKLRKLIINQNSIEIGLLCDKHNYELTEFYFNRDPFVLNMILNYFQTDKLHVSITECVLFLKDELEYWQIDEYAFQSCCQVVYHDKLESADELIHLENIIYKRVHQKDDYGNYCFPKIREKLWNLFDRPNSSIYARFLFCFSIFIIMLSNLELSIKSYKIKLFKKVIQIFIF